MISICITVTKFYLCKIYVVYLPIMCRPARDIILYRKPATTDGPGNAVHKTICVDNISEDETDF